VQRRGEGKEFHQGGRILFISIPDPGK